MEESIMYNGKPYYCTKWNGEYYATCYEAVRPGSSYPAVLGGAAIALRPVYTAIPGTDDCEVTGYEEV